jgi:hypothetical protein
VVQLEIARAAMMAAYYLLSVPVFFIISSMIDRSHRIATPSHFAISATIEGQRGLTTSKSLSPEIESRQGCLKVSS